jgi:hypothetical protein
MDRWQSDPPRDRVNDARDIPASKTRRRYVPAESPFPPRDKPIDPSCARAGFRGFLAGLADTAFRAGSDPLTVTGAEPSIPGLEPPWARCPNPAGGRLRQFAEKVSCAEPDRGVLGRVRGREVCHR